MVDNHEDMPSVAAPALLYVAELTEAQHKAAQEAAALATRRAVLVVEVAALEDRLALLQERNREVLAPLEETLWGAISAARAATAAREESAVGDRDWSGVEDLAVASADWILAFSQDADTTLEAVRSYVSSVASLLALTDLEVAARAYALLAARDAEQASIAATRPDM
jgi:hypothetical protein